MARRGRFAQPPDERAAQRHDEQDLFPFDPDASSR